MGGIYDSELRRVHSRYEPRPTAALGMEGETTATMLVCRDADGWEWEYGDEIPIHVRLHDLKSVALPTGRESLFWTGIEVRVKRNALPGTDLTGHYIAAALLPRAFRWWTTAPLRPGWSEAEFPDRTQHLARLEAGYPVKTELPFDPFLSDPGWLVARLGDLTRPDWQEKDAEDVGDGVYQRRTRSRKSSIRGSLQTENEATRRWYFGLTPMEPDLIAQRLAERKTSSDGEITDNIPLRNRAVHGLGSGGAVDITERQQMGTGVAAPRPTTSMAEGMLRVACELAMAGIDPEPRPLLQTRIWNHFHNLFRDEAQRLWYDQQAGSDDLRGQAFLEGVYRDFIGEQPDCNLFRREGKVDSNLLASFWKQVSRT